MTRLCEVAARVGLLVGIFLNSVGSVNAAPREEQRLDEDWRFHHGEMPGAFESGFDATSWPAVLLPHDWSIALPVDAAAPTAGHGGFFPGGIGWYRRLIAAPETWAGRRVEIEFEGVYQNAEVWINGILLGHHVYGYTPFRFDLTPHLRLGADNILAVRVDNSRQPNSRWYTGSGLYRPVWLRVTDQVRVVTDGVFITTTALTERLATVQVHATLGNAADSSATPVVDFAIVSAEGKTVASARTESTIAAGGEQVATANVQIPDPRPWSPDMPALYQLVTRVRGGGRTLDEQKTTFGVRTVRVSAERGFELNGRPLKLLGGNVHHDNGVLGSAAFDRAEERKVELLKAAGFNAVRTAHNPPSTAFLDACDRLGLLVMDELYDGWEKAKTKHDQSTHFRETWRNDVEAWVRRDRNHPSVAIWSIGNEMYERGSTDGQRIARELAGRIRELDPSRPVSAGVNGLGKSGDWTQLDPLFATLDIAGYNYELSHHAADHARLPKRVIIAAESYQSEVFANWVAMENHSYVVGDFVWSALDYLGEAGIGRVFPPGEAATPHWVGSHFPWHGAYCGDIDLTGWRKPVSHYRQIVWDRGEKLYAAVLVPAPGNKPWNVTLWSVPPALPGWTWPGREGESLIVEVYSRYDVVRLTLNGRMVGDAPTTRSEEFKARFPVPYAPGELRVTGLQDGREMESLVLKTAGETTSLRLTVDRSRLRVDGEDLAFVTIEACDQYGAWNPTATPVVTLAVTGPGTLAAAGTGNLASLESYQGNTHTLFQGRALAVIRSGRSGGRITLTATAPDLPVATAVLNTSQP